MSVVKTGLNVILVGVAVVISVLVITHQRGFEDKDIQKVQSVANTATVDATKAAAIKADTARLSELVTSFAQPYGTKVGVVVTDLADGASANVNGNEQFVSASIYKLFVGYDIYKKIDAGTLLYDQVVQTPDDENSTNTVSGCLNLMITISDNGCGEALAALEGWANLDAMLKSEGYTGTMLNNYMDNGEELNGDKQTDANDVALLLSRLYDGTLLSVASTNAYPRCGHYIWR
jgi:beta-lactamase class A